MRKLTVKRKFSIVECASKVFLYVQCPKQVSTHNFDGMYFKQYRLKNGKAVETDILDDPTVVIVETSTMRVGYTVPQGDADVTLVTKPRYCPSEGNPFSLTQL